MLLEYVGLSQINGSLVILDRGEKRQLRRDGGAAP